MNDGGYAFPRAGWENLEASSPHDTMPQSGMSLRDYFAAMAVQGIIAQATHRDINAMATKRGMETTEFIAKVAYEHADSMLAEREKTK